MAWVETAARAVELAAPAERARLSAQRPTIDVDSTEIEVFGRAKRGAAYYDLGQLAVLRELIVATFATVAPAALGFPPNRGGLLIGD